MPFSISTPIADQIRSYTEYIVLAIKHQWDEDINILTGGSANFDRDEEDSSSCSVPASFNYVARSAAYLRILAIVIPLFWMLVLFLRRIRMELNDDLAVAAEEEMPYEHYAMNFEKFFYSQIRYSRQPYRTLVLNPDNKLVLNMNKKKRSVIYGFNLLVLLKDLFAFVACCWRKPRDQEDKESSSSSSSGNSVSNGNAKSAQTSSVQKNNGQKAAALPEQPEIRNESGVGGHGEQLYMEAPKSYRIHTKQQPQTQTQTPQLEQEQQQEQTHQNSPLHLNHLRKMYAKPETPSTNGTRRTVANDGDNETFVHTLKKERSNTASQFYFDSVEHETHLYSVQHNNRIVYQYQFDHDLQQDNGQTTPLLVFINTGSGPQQGSVLLGQLRRILNPIQVFDLNNISAPPESILTCFISRFQRSLRILVCGGDGTVAWILGALDKCKTSFKAEDKLSLAEIDVPIAILPLGTGNDLARILGWGGGFGSSSRNDTLIEILNRVATAKPVHLDRWTLSVDNDNNKSKSARKLGFTNYVGVGCDAAAALQIHMLRQSRPSLFSIHRILNQFFYALMGSPEVIYKSYKMADMCELICDGESVPLPPDCQAIVCLNIDCFAGGIPIWDRALTEYRHARNRNQNRHGSFMVDGHGRNGRDHTPVQDDWVYNSTLTWPKLSSLSAANLLNAATAANGYTHEDHDNAKFKASSYNDSLIDVCYVRGAFHLGQIKVGLSNAKLLAQARSVKIKIKKNKVQMPIQWDGEPQLLSPGAHTLEITNDGKAKQSCMLEACRTTNNLAHARALDYHDCESVLLWARDTGVIDVSAYEKIIDEMNRRYGAKGKLTSEAGDELSCSEKEGYRLRSLSFT